jgi:hypothetical protein
MHAVLAEALKEHEKRLEAEFGRVLNKLVLKIDVHIGDILELQLGELEGHNCKVIGKHSLSSLDNLHLLRDEQGPHLGNLLYLLSLL